MPQFGLLILTQVFTALFPPVDSDEATYYDVLDVKKSATPEDIRKAYKKLSLKLHPDKIAQRGGANAEDAAREYEKVQEAYGVLANEQKRATYDILKTPTRYRFYANGALANPGALYENLTSASFVDKTRLIAVVTALIILVLLQPILICSKINQDLQEEGSLQNTSWFAIFVPYWIIGGIIILLTALLLPFVPKGDRLPLCLSALEQFCWYLSMIFLCFRWDQEWDSPYRQIFTPVYIAMLLRWTQSFVMLRKVRKDVQRMVTVDYLEKEVLKEKTLEDLEENELKELQEAYLVVTVPPDFEPFAEEGVQLNDEKIEEQKVEASQEFEAATEIYNNTVTGVANSIFFGTIFLILLTRKLDGKLDSSWWVVFIPIFLERGLRWLVNLHRCACGRVVGEEIVIQMSHPNTAEANTENDESAEKEQETKTEKTSEKTSKKSSNSQTSGDEESSKEAFKSKEKASQAAVVVESDVVKESSISDKPSSSEVDTKESDTGEDADEKQKIHIDEETFHAWQNAYEQAEQDAMQEQAKASSECCSLSLQLILLCLVVAKIEQSYFSDDPNDVGFSMFWILFPFFLFFGIVCCCCTLLIYGAAPGSSNDLHDEAHDEQDPENPPVESIESTKTSPIVVPESNPEDGNDVKETKQGSEKDDEKAKEKIAEVGVEVEAAKDGEPKLETEESMDDLD